LDILAYIFTNNERLTLFVEQGVSLVNIVAQKWAVFKGVLFMKRTILGIPARVSSLLVVGLICLFAGIAVMGCSSDSDTKETPWLADLSNPFLGKWETYLPEAQMSLVFDYKTDGTFDYEIKEFEMSGTGGYVVQENMMVTWLDIEGATAYTFNVVDNDTIDVTELELNDDSELVPGDTAPFKRVAGSPVNKENKPFVLTNDFIGGKWSSSIPSMDNATMVSEYKADGTCTVIFPDVSAEYGGGVLYTGCYIVYEDKFVSYVEGDGLGAFKYEKTNANIFQVTEIDGVNEEDNSLELGNTSTFARSELAKWAGTWNPVYWYFDETELAAILEAQYEAMPDASKQNMSLEVFIAFVKAIAQTDFGSFVIQGNTITFYTQQQTQKNPLGDVLETVTYTFKGTRSDVWGAGGPEEEEFDWYAFEGDTEGAHKYLLLEEAGRDTPTGPLHFHMRYGSKGFDDLLYYPTDNYNRWAPTIVSYATTIAELQEFMSGD
jgi:Zn/Cd-binding protein ZinT